MSDRLHHAFEALARRGTPRDPADFAASVLGTPAMGGPTPPGRRARATWVLAAAVVAAVVAIAAVAAGRDDGGDQVVLPANLETSTTTTTTAPPPFPSTPTTGTVFGPGGPNTTVPPTRSCPDVHFAPNSDDVASDVVATGIDCDGAELLVRRVRARHNFVSGPRSFQQDGYACTVRTDDEALPAGHYDCTRGTQRVRWTKT